MSELPKILESMRKVNEELKPIAKDQKGYGYYFRGINDVLNALHPLFKKHSIITRRENVVISRNRLPMTAKDKEPVEVTMTADYIFTSLLDGSELRTMGMGEGIDSSGGDKAISMATSNSYKYVIFELFNIATEEQLDSDQVTAKENKKENESKQLGNSFRKLNNKESNDVL